jgi:hypothetical protein
MLPRQKSCYHSRHAQFLETTMEGEVFFEFVQIGQQMRVAAIDVDTGTEVIVIAPVKTARSHMQQVALAKLRKKLADSQPTPPSGTLGKYA